MSAARPVIIGAGVNGLVAGFLLARSGLRPLVLERFGADYWHTVVIDDGARKQPFEVWVDPGANVSVAPAPIADPVTKPSPTSNARAARASSNGLSPAWFWTGAGVSAVVGGLTIASAVDTRNTYEEFSAAPSANLKNEGLDAQLRTNLLLAGTAATVIATVS